MKIKNVLSFLLAAVMTATTIPVVAASPAPAEPISASVSGATTIAAEIDGNKYLYIKNRDFRVDEGVQLTIAPIEGVTKYFFNVSGRYANLEDDGKASPKIVPIENATVPSDRFLNPVKPTWNNDNYDIWASPVNAAQPMVVGFAMNGQQGNVYEIDSIRVFYKDAGGSEVDITTFAFDDGLLAKDGIEISAYDAAGTANNDGTVEIAIREEQSFSRVANLNATDAGKLVIDESLEVGVYTLSGEFRMPYFQDSSSVSTHKATVTVYNNGVEAGSFVMNPYWNTYSVEGITIRSASDELTLGIESGITDSNATANSYKNGIDIIGLKLTKTADYDPDKDAAEQVDALITAIGEVTDDSEDKITAARAAYTALNDTAKSYVTKLAVLEAAEEAFVLLSVTKPAKAVDALIMAIGEVTEDSENKITAARAAYTALGDASKAYVTKLSVLEAAEALFKFLTVPGPISGADPIVPEVAGNKYLYIKNKDYDCNEGAKLTIAPIDGVTKYFFNVSGRYANIEDNGVASPRIVAITNATVPGDTFLNPIKAIWNNDDYDVWASPVNAEQPMVIGFALNGAHGNAYEIDSIRVFYKDAQNKEIDITTFDFDDGLLSKNGITISSFEDSRGSNQDGAVAVVVREEQNYYRIEDLNADDAGTMTLEETLEPAVYTLSGEFRMPYFQNIGSNKKYNEGTHTATVTVKNGETELGTFEISPYWNKIEMPFATLTPIDSLQLTIESGITDTTDYADAIDYLDVKVTKTRSFEGTVPVEGTYITSLNTYSTDDLGEVTSEDGFLHIYGRSGSGNGFGFTFDDTFNKDETYTIKFRARQPLASAHIATLSIAVAKDGEKCINRVPDANLENPNFANIPMAKEYPYYNGNRGVGVVEGWFDYTFTFTPRDGDIENPDIAIFPVYFNEKQHVSEYRYQVGTNWYNAVNPIDIDWIEIFDGNSDSVYRNDFDGTLDTSYVAANGDYQGDFVKNTGSTKMVIAEDDHMTIIGKDSTPTLKITGFDVPELVPGKYALTFDARLGYYEAPLGFENSVASLDMAVTNTDSTTAAKKTEINTEWTQVIYSFFVTEDCKPEKIEITLSGIEGGVENLKRFDFKNFAVSSQIFEIQTEDETSLMNGVEIYSVGDTVKTEVLAEDGVTPDGYLHIYDRPLDLHHGVAFKINTPLKGGERYIITLRARMSHTATGNTTLTVSGNGIATGYNERNPSKDYETRWAMPVIGKTPAPYFSTTQGAYVKDYWQEYSFEYAPVDDIAEPIFSLLSNYYWNNDGSGDSVRWGSQYQLNQDAIDIDDIVIYKVGNEANPIYTDNFNNGVGETYQPAEGTGGSNVGADLSRGGSNYGEGSSKLAHGTDVYESVVNNSAAPELNLSGFNEFPAGKYALTVWIRNNLIYDSNKSFENQETVTLTVVATHSTAPDTAGGEEGTDVELQRYEIGHEWQQISYIFKIDESTTSLEKIRMYLDNGNQPGSFDYRGFEFELIEEEVLPAPDPGVVMMFLYKKQIRKVTNPEEFIREEKVDENVFIDKDYFEGALTEEGLAKWTAPVQTLEAGKLAGGADYIKVRNIKNNYMPISFVTEERVPAGSYHFMLDLRTANIGETTQLEISIGGQSRLIRIDNNWTSLEFLLRTEQAGEISISFRGGPLAFYTQDYDIANLALRTLDNRKVEVNAFDHTDFENPALATRGMSYGGKGMTFTHMTETVGEGEDAVTNSFVRIADRVRNYDNLFLNTGVKMEAGETYTITYDIRLAEPEGTDTMRSQVGIPNSVTTKLRVDPNQNSEYTNANYNAFTITPEWKTVTATFVAAESGTMVIGINGGASTENIKSYDIDNLVIMAKVAPTIRIGDNKWEAGNFEDAATALAAWKGETNQNLGWVGGTFEHRTDEDGNSYIHIGDREANYQNFTLNTGVSVSAGATYQITYRIRAVEDTRLRSSAGAASAKNYKLKVAGEGADDPASSSYHAFAVPTQWKTITTLYVAETDGMLGINFFGDSSPEYIHSLDFDDFEIYEVYAG